MKLSPSTLAAAMLRASRLRLEYDVCARFGFGQHAPADSAGVREYATHVLQVLEELERDAIPTVLEGDEHTDSVDVAAAPPSRSTRPRVRPTR